MISLVDYLTASGKYPDREHHKEVTPTVINNAILLLAKVNPFLAELGIKSVIVSSGFRPSTVNASLPNSAKKSLHMIGSAIDIVDPDGSLDALLERNDVLKKKYGLWQEDPNATKGWAHLDNKPRGMRPKNTFIP
jgi:Peptidase M15